jgi:uncharacterized protein YqeY
MSYSEKISNDLKQAMKDRQKDKLEALRAVKTAFTLAKSEKSSDYILTEAEELKILQKLVKQRKDSAAIYKEQNREDLYIKEILEADFIEEYLPAQMSVEEMETVIKAVMEKLGASGMQDMGKVMGLATKELAGKADGRIIAEMVKKLLLTST